MLDVNEREAYGYTQLSLLTQVFPIAFTAGRLVIDHFTQDDIEPTLIA